MAGVRRLARVRPPGPGRASSLALRAGLALALAACATDRAPTPPEAVEAELPRALVLPAPAAALVARKLRREILEKGFLVLMRGWIGLMARGQGRIEACMEGTSSLPHWTHPGIELFGPNIKAGEPGGGNGGGHPLEKTWQWD